MMRVVEIVLRSSIDLSNIFNTIAADALLTQGARPPATTVSE